MSTIQKPVSFVKCLIAIVIFVNGLMFFSLGIFQKENTDLDSWSKSGRPIDNFNYTLRLALSVQIALFSIDISDFCVIF